MRPLGVRAALAAARALYRLFPGDFRARFGGDVARDLDAAAEAETHRGGPSGLRLAWRVVRDVARALPGAWARHFRHERTPRGGGGAEMAASRSSAWIADARYALKSLGRSPAFTALVVLVMAAGVGAVTSVMAVVDAYLLRGLPYPESDRLVNVRGVQIGWREVGDVFDPAVTWDLDVFSLIDADRPRQVPGAWVSPGYLEAFGVAPALGRLFTPDEAGPDGASVALISHRLWQERYQGDPGVIGRQIPAFTSDRPDDAESFTVVGVLPADLWHFNRYTEFLAPLRADNPVYMGRLRPGVSAADAAGFLTRLADERGLEIASDGVQVLSQHEQYVARVRPTLTVLVIAVGLVLLVACGNAAMLLAVRSTGRAREFAVRRALGGQASRLVRQVGIEGLMLAGVASVLGLGAAALLVDGLAVPIEQQLGLSIPGGADALAVSGTAALVAAGAALVTGLVFGLVPAVGALSRGGGMVAAGGARGATGSRARARLRNALILGELALSLTLLTGAGLALRSARHLATVDLGFDPAGVTVGEVLLRAGSYPEADGRARFHDAVIDEVRALPEVAAAAWSLRVPFTWRFNLSPVESETAPAPSAEDATQALLQVAGEGYFEALGIPVLRGRAFHDGDTPESEPVVIVSEGLAEQLWPGQDPVGRRMRGVSQPNPMAPDAPPLPWRRVVGVVPDGWSGMELAETHSYYAPHRQLAPLSSALVVRTRDGGPAPVRAIKHAIQQADPTVAFASVVALEAATSEATAPSRFLAGLLTAFSGFAALLAVLGLYGVVAHAAAQRAREVAVRMALGADRGRVVRAFVFERTATIALGLVAGALGGLALGRALGPELRGVDPDDPVTLASVATFLALAALAATWLPARRAATAEPARVLREE